MSSIRIFAIALALAVPVTAPALLSNTTAEASEPAAGERMVVFDVKGFTCSGCTESVAEALRAQEGVVAADVSFDDKRATVTFDPAKITTDVLAGEITGFGFEVTVKETLDG